MNRSTPGLPVHHQLPEFTQTHVHWVGDAIQPSHPLPSPSLLPSISPSITVFSNESALPSRWPKYWSFSFNISPSNEHPGLICFRMDCWISLQSKGLSRVFSNRKTNLTPHWIRSSAITLVLYCPCSVMLVMYLLLKNVAYSMKYTRQSILTALTIKGITLFYSYRDKKLQSRG